MADRYGFETLATTLDEQHILRVEFNRPERLNALNVTMHSELRDLFLRIADDDDVDIVVLTGRGKAFCVGADFGTMDQNLEHGYPDGHPGLMGDSADMARNILAVRQPMIAAVNGDAIGLGATLALFCDITYMADGARIGDPHVRAGIVAGDGGPVLWPLLIGANRAKEYLMTGDLLTAAEADHLGLINHVVAADDLDEAVMKMARKLAAGPQIAVRFNKRLVNKDLEDRVNRLYDLSLALEAITFETKDHQEAVRSFLEKRKPVFGRAREAREQGDELIVANNKLYIHEYIDIIGHNRANYMHHMTANFSPMAQVQRNQLCYGVWGTVGSTHRWPEVLNMWEEDGFDGMATSFRHEFGHPTLQDPALAAWWARAAQFRRSGRDRLLIPAEWTRTIEELCADGVTGETYAHELVQVKPGTAWDYVEMVRQYAIPLYEQFGWIHAGAFVTSMVNDSEALILWAIPTWEHWAEFEKAQRTDPAVKAWRARASGLAVDWIRMLLVDSPLCPFRTGRQPQESDRDSYKLPDDPA